MQCRIFIPLYFKMNHSNNYTCFVLFSVKHKICILIKFATIYALVNIQKMMYTPVNLILTIKLKDQGVVLV